MPLDVFIISWIDDVNQNAKNWMVNPANHSGWEYYSINIFGITL